ncbi:tryptophan synthase subunit alpha [bacterium]|nr:tryptophan synthase subunit alpha [bacterium]
MNNLIDKNSLIAFIMAGDPDLETTKNCILSMEKAGADLIELGIPFSDPIAESSVIQSANLRALKSETYLSKIFEVIKEIRAVSNIPIIFHSYVNPIFNYGYEQFFEKCKETKVSGIVSPDLPLEEKNEIKEYADKNGINIISIVVPAPKERIERIAKEATGFIYFIPSISSTGVLGDDANELNLIVETIKNVTDTPVAVGFGINTPAQAEYFSKKADGIILGNGVVKIIEKNGKLSAEPVYNYVKEMKTAIIK